MSVTTLHPEYTAYLETWDALESAYIGSGAIKGAVDHRSSAYTPAGVKMAGTKYLPRPAGMRSDAQYAVFRDSASWFPGVERATHGITGAIFRKEPTLTVPTRLEEGDLRDITLTGMPWQTFAQQTVLQTLLLGRYGILVDYPAPDALSRQPRGVSQDLRPYWVGYGAKQIRNWETDRRGGDTVLTLVVLYECLSQRKGPWGTDDFFVREDRPQYRVLRLDEQNRYEVSIWPEVPTTMGQRAVYQDLSQTFIPLRQGQPLRYIPFTFLSAFSLEPQVQKSLLEGLAEVNYRYYRHSANHENNLFLLAPTPIISVDGIDPQTELVLGPSVAWVLPGNAKWGTLGSDPAALAPLHLALETDKKDMAILGARLLEAAPDVAETATANENRLAGTESPIQTLISTVSQGLTQALQTHAWWSGLTENDTDPDIQLQLNRDIVARSMSPQLLQALTQDLMQHAISFETFWYNLQQGEIARPGVSAEEEQELIRIAKEQEPLVVVQTPGQPPPRPGQPPVPPRQNGVTRPAA